MRITDEQYRTTEGRLYRHFRKMERLRKVETRVNGFEQERTRLRDRIAAGIQIQPPSGTARYSDMPPSNSGFGNPLEHRLEMAEEVVEHMTERLVYVEERLANLEVEMGKLREETSEVEFALSLLGDEDNAIARQRYDFERSNVQISVKLNCSEATVRRRVPLIVKRIAQLLEIADTSEGREWASRRDAKKSCRERNEEPTKGRRDYQAKLC